MGGQIHSPKKYFFEKLLTVFRMGMLGFMVFGSLLFNIGIYLSCGPALFLELCFTGEYFHWIGNCNRYFELFKRLNGVYIMIFMVTNKNFRNFLRNYAKKRIGNSQLCRRLFPRKIARTTDLQVTQC
jgi:hypothetical protein